VEHPVRLAVGVPSVAAGVGDLVVDSVDPVGAAFSNRSIRSNQHDRRCFKRILSSAVFFYGLYDITCNRTVVRQSSASSKSVQVFQNQK